MTIWISRQRMMRKMMMMVVMMSASFFTFRRDLLSLFLLICISLPWFLYFAPLSLTASGSGLTSIIKGSLSLSCCSQTYILLPFFFFNVASSSSSLKSGMNWTTDWMTRYLHLVHLDHRKLAILPDDRAAWTESTWVEGNKKIGGKRKTILPASQIAS